MRSSVIWSVSIAAIVLASGGAYWAWSARTAAERREQAIDITGGDPRRAPGLILINGCAGCHQIPGIPMASGRVGPSLSNIRAQTYIAGVLKNTPGNLEHWITSAHDIDVKTAMPNIPLSDQQARDIAAYLYSLP